MKFVYQVSILGDDKIFAAKLKDAEDKEKYTIEYRGETIPIDKARSIVQYLEMYDKTTDDLLRR